MLDEKAGTAAKVRVLIQSQDEHDSWGTVGVSENIIEASWQALVDSIEYKLLKDQKAEGRRQKVKSGGPNTPQPAAAPADENLSLPYPVRCPQRLSSRRKTLEWT